MLTAEIFKLRYEHYCKKTYKEMMKQVVRRVKKIEGEEEETIKEGKLSRYM